MIADNNILSDFESFAKKADNYALKINGKTFFGQEALVFGFLFLKIEELEKEVKKLKEKNEQV